MVGFILTYDNILFLYLYLLPTTIINVYTHFHKKTNIHLHKHIHKQNTSNQPNLFLL